MNITLVEESNHQRDLAWRELHKYGRAQQSIFQCLERLDEIE